MAVQATRSNVITYTGDVTGTQTVNAAANTASPGSIEVQTLANGFNGITVPSSTGVTVVSCTIIPPAGNTTSIILKGITGDTGIRLHNTDPTTIAIYSDVTSIGLAAGAAVQGVRFIWT